MAPIYSEDVMTELLKEGRDGKRSSSDAPIFPVRLDAKRRRKLARLAKIWSKSQAEVIRKLIDLA